MPTYEFGNMFSMYGKTDNFIVTTNSFITKAGELVMGRGIALQLKDRIPDIATDFGSKIKHMGKYYLIEASQNYGQTKFWAFQVKTHFKEKASLGLISVAVLRLRELANLNVGQRFDMNFPGIGFGYLRVEDVKPVIDVLPENVHIWRC